jgi:Ni/Fe-hydrogenase subunit HybB-like protein
LVPLVILGALLSAVHQMMLGSLYLIAPHKLHPLWYSPHLPVFFYLSAVCAGLAVTVFESWHTSAALRTRMEVASLARISRLAAVLLLFYSLLRILDLWHRGAWGMAFDLRPEAGLFHIEVWLMLLPAVWLLRPSAKSNPRVLYGCSVAILMGFLAQRLNVSITAMQAVSDAHYLPKWTELAVTFSMVALGFAMFGFAARHLPLFAAPRAVSRA